MSQTQETSQIRRYTHRDYDAVKPLIQSLARLFEDEFNDENFNRMMQTRMLDSTTGTFVAMHEGEVRGTSFADLERDPRGVLHGRISNVIVEEGFQGLGLGAGLIDESIKFLNAFNVPSIWVNVNPRTENMQRMFEKRDFQNIFVVMERPINSFDFSYRTSSIEQGPVKYRDVINKDLTSVKDLIKDLAAIFNADFDPFWFDLTVQKYFQDPASRIFVGDRDGEIIGTVFAEVRRDPVGYLYGYISNVIISETARGLGVGTNLLQIAIEFLSSLNIAKIWGNVNYGNEGMKGIYEKQGFHQKFTVMGKFVNNEAGC